MPIVTLTTDFGNNDYYLGALKGALLCANAGLQLVDISHNIKSFDIVQAAYFLKSAYPSFPKETIHIISVNNLYQANPVFVAMQHEGQYFIAPDNGVLSLMFEELPDTIYELEYMDESTFPLEEVFGKAVDHITSERPFYEIGMPLDAITERLTYQAVRSANQLKGTIIHIDNYENVITNITEDLFKEVGKKRPFQLYYKRTNPLTELSKAYSAVPIGEALCLINSTGHLELAINMGKAASLLNLKLEDTIQIEFLPV